MISKKGFLFTISVVFFASTMVFFVQSYAAKSALRERQVLFSVGSSLEPFLVDDLSFDMTRLLGLGLSLDSNAASYDFNISLSQSIPLQYSLGQELQKYGSFVDSNHFKRIGGFQQLSLSSLSDGTAELFIGNNLFEYIYNYNEEKVSLLWFRDSSILKRADFTLRAQTGKDNLWKSTWSVSAGAVPVRVIYLENGTGTLDETVNIDPTKASTLTLDYKNGKIITLYFGLVNGKKGSFAMDSDTTYLLSYSLNTNFNYFSERESFSVLPVFFNSILRHHDSVNDANSYLKLSN